MLKIYSFDKAIILRLTTHSIKFQRIDKYGKRLLLIKITKTVYNSDTHRFHYEDQGEPAWLEGPQADRWIADLCNLMRERKKRRVKKMMRVLKKLRLRKC